MALRLLNGIGAPTTAPTLPTDGFSLQNSAPGPGQFYWLKRWDLASVFVTGAGAGAMTFQGIFYVYSVLAQAWSPLGIATLVADRGKLNDGVTITGNPGLAHTQPVGALSPYERIALQATILTGGTVTAYLIPRVQEV